MSLQTIGPAFAPDSTPGPAKLGRLEPVDVRDYWAGEASDFTPWLGREENISLLSASIGLELEVQEEECRVGPFRADIVCVEAGSDHRVLIENQLERTDHMHLGQLMTYAAGLEAVTIVWIAQRFTEEHRAALDWLNRITSEGINFFGIEIELWRIGNSPPAPKFNLVAKPNQWSQRIGRPDGLTETAQLYLDYWTAFSEFAASRETPVRLQRPLPQTWTVVAIGRTYFYLTASVSRQNKTANVQLVTSGPDRLGHFATLQTMRAEIEDQLGAELVWRENRGKKESHIRRNFQDFDPDKRADWTRQHGTLLESLSAFHRCFAPRVKGLEASNEAAEGAEL